MAEPYCPRLAPRGDHRALYVSDPSTIVIDELEIYVEPR